MWQCLLPKIGNTQQIQAIEAMASSSSEGKDTTPVWNSNDLGWKDKAAIHVKLLFKENSSMLKKVALMGVFIPSTDDIMIVICCPYAYCPRVLALLTYTTYTCLHFVQYHV